MIPEPRTFPILDDPDPCAVLNCNDALQLLEVCEKERHRSTFKKVTRAREGGSVNPPCLSKRNHIRACVCP